MLIGDTDAGMYFHNDHLAAASWQAAVVGRKRWVLCRNEDTDIFRGRAGMKPDARRLPIDAFEPDSERFPRFAEAHCADVVVSPGEILYYPAYWYHQTRCLDPITLGVTGLMVGIEGRRRDLRRMPHEEFYLDLRHKCSICWQDGELVCEEGKNGWFGPPIAYDVCYKYLDRCMRLWHGASPGQFTSSS